MPSLLCLQAKYTTYDPFYPMGIQTGWPWVCVAQKHMGTYIRQAVTLPQAFCVLFALPCAPTDTLFQREQPDS